MTRSYSMLHQKVGVMSAPTHVELIRKIQVLQKITHLDDIQYVYDGSNYCAFLRWTEEEHFSE